MADLTDQQFLATDPDVLGLQRQRQLANLLTGQAFNQPQGQMISGHYVAPSALQQALPMINAAIGGLTNANLDTKQQQLAEALRGKQMEVAKRYANATNAQERMAAALDTYAPKAIQTAYAERLKGQKVGKGEKIYYEDGATLEGNPDIPESIQYAISVGGLPQNPASWNDQQRAFAKALVESKANASAGRNITYVGNKSIAEQIGPMMAKDQEKTLAANKIWDSANNLTNVLDSNKIFTGPAANVRLGAAQLANFAGFGGDSLKEKIANTRTGIQSLAQLTLQGRKEMKGEGAIQVQEGQLAERAISGDINFTPTELKILANAAKRSAEYTQRQYERKLQHMAMDKETAGLVPYYAVPPMTPMTSTSGGADGWSVKSVK